MSSIEAKGYVRPEVLVDLDWVAQHKDDANVKLIEVDVDTEAYNEGHIPGAVAWNWTSQLNDPVRRAGQLDRHHRARIWTRSARSC